eukprot:TRINITY_DN4289_c0_g1_i1.p1 TRINITY_DN4289_c0_g1~~TRINITY_DN4289_c0_g1_i1.p1  ORF type:complete len:1710 (-),score=396.50 TRINITY_DN4289_c0_g1_i1:88-5040(-)
MQQALTTLNAQISFPTAQAPQSMSPSGCILPPTSPNTLLPQGFSTTQPLQSMAHTLSLSEMINSNPKIEIECKEEKKENPVALLQSLVNLISWIQHLNFTTTLHLVGVLLKEYLFWKDKSQELASSLLQAEEIALQQSVTGLQAQLVKVSFVAESLATKLCRELAHEPQKPRDIQPSFMSTSENIPVPRKRRRYSHPEQEGPVLDLIKDDWCYTKEMKEVSICGSGFSMPCGVYFKSLNNNSHPPMKVPHIVGAGYMWVHTPEMNEGNYSVSVEISMVPSSNSLPFAVRPRDGERNKQKACERTSWRTDANNDMNSEIFIDYFTDLSVPYEETDPFQPQGVDVYLNASTTSDKITLASDAPRGWLSSLLRNQDNSPGLWRSSFSLASSLISAKYWYSSAGPEEMNTTLSSSSSASPTKSLRSQEQNGILEFLRGISDNSGYVDNQERKRLHYLASFGWHTEVERRVSEGDNVIEFDKWGNTPLYYAIVHGHHHIACLLLEANNKVVEKQLEEGKNLLSVACQHKHLSIASVLIARYPFLVNYPDPVTRETPFLVSCKAGFLAGVEILVSHGANVYQRNREGETALHIAASRGDRVLSSILWTHFGLSMHTPCACLTTPFQIWQDIDSENKSESCTTLSSLPYPVLMLVTCWIPKKDQVALSLTSTSFQWMLAENLSKRHSHVPQEGSSEVLGSLEISKKNRESEPPSPLFRQHVMVGREKLAQNKYQKALLEFQEAVSMDESSTEAWFLQGYALQLSGDKTGALSSFRQTLMLDPSHVMANALQSHVLEHIEESLSDSHSDSTSECDSEDPRDSTDAKKFNLKPLTKHAIIPFPPSTAEGASPTLENTTSCSTCHVSFSLLNPRHACPCCALSFCVTCAPVAFHPDLVVIPEGMRKQVANLETIVDGLWYLSNGFIRSWRGPRERVCTQCHVKVEQEKDVDTTVRVLANLKLDFPTLFTASRVSRSWNQAVFRLFRVLLEERGRLEDSNKMEERDRSLFNSLVWENRCFLAGHSSWLLYLLRSVHWQDPGMVSQALLLLDAPRKHLCKNVLCHKGCKKVKTDITLGTALELLGRNFSHPAVRAKGLRYLNELPDSELKAFLPILVFNLRFDDSTLHNFLLVRAAKCPIFYHHLLSSISVYSEDPLHSALYSSFEREIWSRLVASPSSTSRSLSPSQSPSASSSPLLYHNLVHRPASWPSQFSPSSSTTLHQPASTPLVEEILKEISFVRSLEGVTPKTISNLARSPILKFPLPMPTSPGMQVMSINFNDVRFLEKDLRVHDTGKKGEVVQERMCDIAIPCKVRPKGFVIDEGRNISWLNVVSRDLRMSATAVNIIHAIQNILKNAGIDVTLVTPKIVVASPKKALLEIPASTLSLTKAANLMSSGNSFLATASSLPLLSSASSLLSHSLSSTSAHRAMTEEEKEEKRKRFATSAAAYAVITYILGIDTPREWRVTKEGDLFLLDFQITSLYSTFSPELRLTPEMSTYLGGEQSEHHKTFKEYCNTIYKAIQPHYHFIDQMMLPLFFASPPVPELPSREKFLYLVQNRFILRKENAFLNQKTQNIINTLSKLTSLPLLPRSLNQDTALHVFDTIQTTTQQSHEFFENLMNFSGQSLSDVGRVVRSESTAELVGNVPVVGTTVAALLKKITS